MDRLNKNMDQNQIPKVSWLNRQQKTVSTLLNTVDTPAARIVNVIIVLFIVLSAVIFICDSISALDSWQGVFNQFEAGISIFFTIEYVLRLWIAPKPKYKYVFSLFALIDLLSILPFYLVFIPFSFFKTIRLIRIIRVLRTLRLLKLSRQMKQKLSETERKASAFKVEMQILAISMITIILIFSSVMYVIESAAGTKGFEDVLTSMWYVMVTITTVGYGDVVPATIMGKVVACFIMLSGIGLIGTLTGIIGKEMMARLAINTAALDEAGQEVTHPDTTVVTLPVPKKYCPNTACPDHEHTLEEIYCKTCGSKLKDIA